MVAGVSFCQKSIFAILVDGEVNSPATVTLTRFYWNLSDFGRKICNEAIFSSVRKLPAKKYAPRGVHAAAADLNVLFSNSTISFFDKQKLPLMRERYPSPD